MQAHWGEKLFSFTEHTHTGNNPLTHTHTHTHTHTLETNHVSVVTVGGLNPPCSAKLGAHSHSKVGSLPYQLISFEPERNIST